MLLFFFVLFFCFCYENGLYTFISFYNTWTGVHNHKGTDSCENRTTFALRKEGISPLAFVVLLGQSTRSRRTSRDLKNNNNGVLDLYKRKPTEEALNDS